MGSGGLSEEQVHRQLGLSSGLQGLHEYILPSRGGLPSSGAFPQVWLIPKILHDTKHLVPWESQHTQVMQGFLTISIIFIVYFY